MVRHGPSECCTHKRGTMYGAATNGAEIVSLFGQIVGGKAALVFDVDTSMVFDSLTSLTGLEDSIMIVA